jgi:hypothetical protein
MSSRDTTKRPLTYQNFNSPRHLNMKASDLLMSRTTRAHVTSHACLGFTIILCQRKNGVRGNIRVDGTRDGEQPMSVFAGLPLGRKVFPERK